MSSYCQDHAILWLHKAIAERSPGRRAVCLELALADEQMACLADRLDTLAEQARPGCGAAR